MLELVQQVKAPPNLVNLINEEYKPITTIKKVILAGGTDLLHGKMAVFNIETGAIIIDIRACMRNTQWIDKGMSFVPNVWCNLIYCVFHEGAHAQQAMDEKVNLDEAAWGTQQAILDHAVDIEALEKMIDWFEINGQTPNINDLGWAGDNIRILFNNLYNQSPDLIGIEMDLLGTKAGGLAIMAAQNPYFESAEAFDGMMEAVDDGDIGLKVKGNLCLKISDFLEINALNHREYRATTNPV